IPSVIRLVAPSARRRLCSPVSWASANIVFNGLVASSLAISELSSEFAFCSLSFLIENCCRKSGHCKTKALRKSRRAQVLEVRSVAGFRTRQHGCSCLHSAVLATVQEIDEHADNQPANQPKPGCGRQARHQVERHNHPKNWNNRNPWSFEWARQVRTAAAQDPYTGAHNHESQQCSDTHEFAEICNWDHSAEDRHEK